MSVTNRCPYCSKTNIQKKKRYGCAFVIFLFVSMGLGLVMIPFLPTEYKCRNCKTEWR